MNEILFSRRLWAFFVSLVICFYSLPVQGKYGGGTGEPNDPYQIADANDLLELGTTTDDYDKHFMLIADVNMVGYTFTTAVIAPKGSTFMGTFDGQGHKISGLVIDDQGAGEGWVGLFGQIGADGQVKNLNIEDISIVCTLDTTYGYIGALCGVNYGGTVDNCHVSGSVYGKHSIGILCGANFSGTITGCSADGSVWGSAAGGLCGYNTDGLIRKCVSSGHVNGRTDSSAIGGFCGRNSLGLIMDCYSKGPVTGGLSNDRIGGFCGHNTKGVIIRCFATGPVSTGDDSWGIGGFCGRDDGGLMRHCLWDRETSGMEESDGGTMLNTTEMMDAETYIYWGDDVWTIDDGNDYPHLALEEQLGTVISDDPRAYGGGSGTSEDPYLIDSGDDLVLLSSYPADWVKCYRLSQDIDFSAHSLTASLIPVFTGEFDGNGQKITSLIIGPGESESFVGLFGMIYGDAQIMNLGLDSISVSGEDRVGGLCGYNAATINDCYAKGVIVGNEEVGGLCGANCGTVDNSFTEGNVNGSNYVGGFCGYSGHNYRGLITNSHSTCSVEGNRYIGGLCGFILSTSYADAVIRCYATGSVSGSLDVGGLFGRNSYATVRESYASGTVSGVKYTGGFCGTNRSYVIQCIARGAIITAAQSVEVGGFCGTNIGVIDRCYAVSSVTAGISSSMLGGLCGRSSGTIEECFAAVTVDADGSESLGGLVGNSTATAAACFWDNDIGGPDNGVGTPLPTAQMQIMSTFTDAGWDFVGETANGMDDIWRLCQDLVDYPRLAWEFPSGDFLCPDGVNFIDYSFFASHWLENNCDASNNCGGTDLDLLGTVDIMDIRIFVDNWLEGVKPPIPPPPGCIAHWKLDDGSGNTATDSAGTNNGALIGNPTWTTGRVDGALSFDGSAEYVVAAPVAPLAGDNFTALAWIRIDESAGLYNSFLMQNRFDDNYGFFFYISHSRPDVYIFGSSGNANTNSTETLNANQWYHIATTNDGSNLKLYVDGQLKDTDSSAGLTGVNENAYIGFDPISSIYYMGLIDDVRIYNRALTEEEIAYLAD